MCQESGQCGPEVRPSHWRRCGKGFFLSFIFFYSCVVFVFKVELAVWSGGHVNNYSFQEKWDDLTFNELATELRMSSGPLRFTVKRVSRNILLKAIFKFLSSVCG